MRVTVITYMLVGIRNFFYIECLCFDKGTFSLYSHDLSFK